MEHDPPPWIAITAEALGGQFKANFIGVVIGCHKSEAQNVKQPLAAFRGTEALSPDASAEIHSLVRHREND